MIARSAPQDNRQGLLEKLQQKYQQAEKESPGEGLEQEENHIAHRLNVAQR